MKLNRIWFSLCMVLVLSFPLEAQLKRTSEITKDELRHHLRYIASDEIKGRRAGSPEAEIVARYIANEFKTYGLSPMGTNGSYFQPFEFVSGVQMGTTNTFSFSAKGMQTTWQIDKDFRPLGFSSTGTFTGEVVFVGYGIVSEEKKYDDYEGVDVKGKAVLVLRYHPEGDNQHSEFNQYASLRYKASKAKEKGAAAILVVTGPADTDRDELMRLSYDQSAGNSGLPSFSLTQAAANRLLQAAGTTMKLLQDSINATTTPRSFLVADTRISVTADVREVHETGRNVVGFLEGNDPALRNEVLVIGAHFDHLGMGGEGSGSLQPDTIAIHNGADDNGSGTVGLLELAQWYGAHKSMLHRSLLFISFSGEELGLLGSSYYVNNPTLPLNRVIAMMNMDMIGRLKNRKLIVYGVGTSPHFEQLAVQMNADSSFDLRLLKDGFGPSDQSSFYSKNIPVYHFFTDLHEDYHRPSDDWDKINYDGMVDVLRYVRSIATDLDSTSDKPEYVKVEQPRATGTGRGIRSYTGTIPDFGEQVEGMKISGVREGSPADKAGLVGGDIIVKFGKLDIKNLYDYTFALGEYKPGDEVDITVKRGNELITMKLTVGRRN